MNKKIPVIVLLLLLGLFFSFDLQQWLTLEQLKSSQAQLSLWQQQSPYLLGLVFFAAYILVTALSLPGAVIMTLAAGAIFGLTTGTLIVSFASSIGATLAFLTSRYVFQNSVQQHFGNQLAGIDAGIARDGAFYLFTLRLLPVFPFFLINLLMGLTSLKTRTFYWVSQAGMLAGTVVYVNAGTQLAKIESLSGILSPALLFSFVLLGVFPLLAKWVVTCFQRRKIYKKWNKPKQFDRNLIVIGGGAAGLVSAYIAAAVKAKVTLIEAHKMGGDCLNYGCVPSKALISSAKLAYQMRHASHHGLNDSTSAFSFRAVMKRVQTVILAVEPHDSVERYTKLGVDVLQGYATLIDPWTVSVKHQDGSEQRLTARSVIIAAGAEPIVPDLPGINETGYYTSDTLWEAFARMDEIPRRMVILGGGPIGCELAQSFARLGAQVYQIERGNRLMPREDTEVSEFAQTQLSKSGVQVLTGHIALRCEVKDGQKWLMVKTPNGEQSIAFDALVCAVGRKARLSGYGLEQLGVETTRTVITNDYLQTLYPNIYAAGDVAGPYQFTHTAAHQAWYASVNALFGEFKRFKVDYSVIPWCTFIDPEVARVGLSEQDAKAGGIAYEVTRFDIDDLDRAIADGAAQGFIKVLTVPGKDKILGVTIVGAHAGELLAEYVLAMKHGLGLNKILGTIHTYPTMAEANKYVAGEWKRAHAPAKLLQWAEKYHRWARG
ncbi:FAD-dependent oxidoreductase [Iodobacter ciconiae]|uniref:Pyridine nucleotide-disulfide oxidoreductase n=1 Tax=Iodobacter ciconiae TaxID=2496266 RepID=A0A3S8ZRQ4_9NEIS|nr:bifunctional TVP38/TMEM64 family protein/FAD-dependent oxidoreductase [Iodobacter ciconiae]AZN36183.1 pyridine nucleotide-disulfide oxidoreductase [Iodobacter ciconiae]